MKQHWKRTLVILACVLIACTALAGCRRKYQDGTYTARYRNPSGGYVEYLTVTFKKGKTASVEFDGYSASEPDTKKSELSQAEYPMDPHPSKWTAQLESSIMKAGDNARDIELIAGATSSSRHARELYAAILMAAEKGDTTEIILDNEAENSGIGSGSSDSLGVGEPDNSESTGMTDNSGTAGDSSTSGSDSMSAADSMSGSDSMENSGSMSGSGSAADSTGGNTGATEGVLPDSGSDSAGSSSGSSQSTGD